MPQSSSQSRGLNHRVNSLQHEGKLSREPSRSRKHIVTHADAYTYALRVAYLSYLLQPRARRTQHVPGPQMNRSSTSFNDLMKDFSIVRDSKSTRFPHGFMSELEKRLTAVLVGKEKHPEYQDALVKRTFAVFFNAFTEQSFKKRMEKDRRVEDLVLIFFSNATRELQKGKAAGDDAWKLMVDRHVALFVRLIGHILKDHDWAKDRPELTTRLATLETKLLAHDRDLANASLTGGTTVEVIVPLSYEVKDMPLVQTVARIFGLTNTQVQSDITKNKPIWTEKAALQDLKTYQYYLNLNTRRTLRSDDFDLEESYETWKRAEGPDLSQMMLAIMQSNPELAKSTSGGQLPQFNGHPSNGSTSSDFSYSEMARKLSDPSVSSYVIDQPVDIAGLSMSDDGFDRSDDAENAFLFIPPDPRAFYRFILMQTLSYDLQNSALEPSEATAETPAIKLLSKQSTELLNEICLRWRIPYFSRMVLFLDAVKEKFVHQEISLDTLDAAFLFIKDPPPDKKGQALMQSVFLDRYKWTVTDYALMQQTLSSLFDALLREVYDIMLHCYEQKPPTVGAVLNIINTHIYEDPTFSKNPEQLDRFRVQLREGLQQKALNIYKDFVVKEVPQEEETWEFYHVIQLGTAVKKIAERIQKRYRKNPEIMGVNPLMVLVEAMLPIYGEDARDLVARIIQQAKEKGAEVDARDGFALYGELVEIRRIHMDALPGVPFAFNVEDLLSDFVWRFIHHSDEKLVGMVEEALKGDEFKIRNEKDGPGGDLPDERRHSYSVISVFQAFNQILREVLALNWDNDLQYAKFMTALARSFGTGLARYCELIEQKFSREMDRLTPEQEAAANQTRQEKWMQLAKDAWNNKEKIEPFQFFQESFVKLNNIAFAIHELDKLETEMNVDGCAEVISRNTPPVQQRPRIVSTYVFTIKIVEAEDLKACDINGLSDPYVVLADEYQKRLAKTRIIYGNLNPRWDDTVDITTQGPLNIIATIWDWDTVGDHDYVGRTSIKLDPAHFKDFLPREYWLDLDTQGRLLLRVSMEGERDDIQFYFGKAFRTLKRTERDMTRKVTDKLSAYIMHCLSRRALRSLLSRGISITSVSSYFNRNKPQAAPYVPTEAEVMNALKPLFVYFDDNFAIMNQTLTSEALIMVMTRLWKEVLVTMEGLLVPPLSDKPSQQRPLTQQELDVVFKWLQMLFDFFHAVDEETGEANGVPINVLKSPKYHEIASLNFFYFDTTENLIRTSERMASATAAKHQAQRNRLSAPPALGTFGGGGGFMGLPSTRRAKSIMLSRNLGTMRKAKEEKWREAQADPNDDMILRILRMRPDAERYLKDRSRQKERLAAAAAAEIIVRQSLLQGGGGRMASNLPKR